MPPSSLHVREVESEVPITRAKTLPPPEVLEVLTVRDIRESTAKKVSCLGENTTMYVPDPKLEFLPQSALPFRVATAPFALPEGIRNNLDVYGSAVVAYYHACDELYFSLAPDHRWKKILDHSKPGSLLDMASNEPGAKHPFLRPDFLLQDDSVTATEIETSPFGLALADFLNKSYRESGNSTAVEADTLINTLAEKTGLKENPELTLCFVITDHTEKYEGQFRYLSERLGQMGCRALVARPSELTVDNGQLRKGGERVDVVYRGFYLHETLGDEKLQSLLAADADIHPPVKPHLEEKSLMAMLFDPEFETFFRTKLGPHFETLQLIFPKTWVVGDRNMPEGVKNWPEIADLPASKRKYVFKPSGFHGDSSWGRGVKFLHKLSKEKCRGLLDRAIQSGAVHIIQEFRKGADFDQEYYDFQRDCPQKMTGRVRLTPYFDTSNGSLLAAKTTLCENTDYIHGMVDAINAPIL